MNPDIDVPLTPLAPEDINPEAARKLFLAILLAHINDACRDVKLATIRKVVSKGENKGKTRTAQELSRLRYGAESEYRNELRERDRSRDWLVNCGPGFTTICECAGFEPSYIHRKVVDLEKMWWPERKPRV